MMGWGLAPPSKADCLTAMMATPRGRETGQSEPAPQRAPSALPKRKKKSTAMQNSRNDRFLAIGLLVLVGIAVGWYLYERYRQQAETELQIQKTARHLRLEQEAVDLVAVSEVAQNAKEIATPNVSLVCVGIEIKGKQIKFGDPAPYLLRTLQASIDKVRPESYCRNLNTQEGLEFYRIDLPYWESDQQVEVGTMKTERIDDTVGGVEIYRLELVNNHWKIASRSVGPQN